ncbi:MAG: glycogen debranching N-terminal domain-containing protein [Acetobacteraceae bacterium]
MSFKVQVGPPQISIHQAQTVLITEPDGQINWPSDNGLYFLDTRVISFWTLFANGEPWDLLNGGATSYYGSRIFQTNRAFLTEDGPIAPRTLGLTLSRHIAGGLHEDIDISNHSGKAVRFNLEIALRGDFADIFEVKSKRIVRRGRITTVWNDSRQQWRLSYRNRDFSREVLVTAKPTGSRTVYANGRLTLEVSLNPDETWHCCLLYDLFDGATKYAAPKDCLGSGKVSKHVESLEAWQRTVLKIRTSNEEFYRCFTQGVEDMAALRLPIAGTDHMVFIPAAGLPWFVALFGRDSLIVSLQTMLVYPEFARGALDVLGAHQAQERDDYRDAEPGKILHELRYGELAHFRLIPHTPYYGTSDATPLYLIALHAAWRATGDRDLIERHLRTAEGCLSWIDKYGDRDGDGFQEYQTRSSAGYENTAWKDSGDSVMYEDGTLVKGPKAICELQGYVYDAWLRMAEIYDEIGRHDGARHLREKAAALFKKFNDVFWNEELGIYAYTLDGEKTPVWSLASNIGHLLWSGIVPKDRAGRVVNRLMQQDMWSGWGIRTLSALHKSFNPYNYQTGAVWPHDNAIIAAGFRRYGFASEAAAVARSISDAASHFLLNQLPELYAGLQRTEDNFPVQYVGANVPQAWAAGTPFVLLQTMLGIRPNAPRGVLYVDPALPDWLPDVALIDLRLGKKTLDIRFWRDGAETKFEVTRGDTRCVVLRPIAEGLNFEAHLNNGA